MQPLKMNGYIKILRFAIGKLNSFQDKNQKLRAVENTCLEIGYSEIVKNKIALRYDYTRPSLVFMIFGVLALLFAFLLKKKIKQKNYGLELPNIQKE